MLKINATNYFFGISGRRRPKLRSLQKFETRLRNIDFTDSPAKTAAWNTTMGSNAQKNDVTVWGGCTINPTIKKRQLKKTRENKPTFLDTANPVAREKMIRIMHGLDSKNHIDSKPV